MAADHSYSSSSSSSSRLTIGHEDEGRSPRSSGTRPPRPAGFPALVVFLLALAGQAARGGAAAPVSPADLFRGHEADRNSLAQSSALPAAPDYLARCEVLESNWLARLDKMDFGALEPADRTDWLVLVTEARSTLRGLAWQRHQLAEVDELLGFKDIIHGLEKARWQPAQPLDSGAAATRLSELTRQLKQLHARVTAGIPPKADKDKPVADQAGGDKDATNGPPLRVTPVQALRAAGETKALRKTLQDWYDFHEGCRPDFAWWLKKPHEEAAKELDDYVKCLREDVAKIKGKDDDPLVGEPAGAAEVAAELRDEWIPYSPEELVAIAERELAWGEQQMRAAAREMGLGDDWKAALERVKRDHAAPGEQDALVAQIAREATDFVRQHRLADVPPLCADSWRLSMLSSENMKTVPYAAYGNGSVMVAYARREMSPDDKQAIMRGNNRHFMRLIIPHELIPGHHLQAYEAARGRPSFVFTPFYVEGWAFYGEMRLWDLGWARTPEDRIGMLFWRMNRCARVIISLKYNIGRMTPDEMVAFLVDRVGHEHLAATSEVRRFLTDHPCIYPAGYLVGALQFRALQKELVGSGQMSDAEFHAAVLRRGVMPVELLRADLRRLSLTRATQPSWRFAE